MSDSSDSDCFESADEGFNDENISVDDNVVKSSKVINDSGHIDSFSFLVENDIRVSSEANKESHVPEVEVQYRKRPERRKNMPKADTPNVRKKSANEKIFKTQIVKPDVLINDITANLSKNFNKGFNTIQQTSSSIKDLVMSSLPVKTSTEHSTRFSYDDEEEKVEKEIASYLPECKVDYSQNKYGNGNSSLFNKCVKDPKESEEKKLLPCMQVPDDKIESEIEAKELDDDVCQDVNLSSKMANEGYMSGEARDVLENDIEESEDFNCLNETNDFCEGVEKGMDEHVSGEEINVGKEENLMKDHDNIKEEEEMENIKEEMKFSNEEENDDDSEPKSTVTEEEKKGTDGNNDGWDTFDIQLEELDLEESSEVSSVENKAVEKDIISSEGENNDAMLKNPTPSCNEGWDDFDFDDDGIDELNNLAAEGKPKSSENHQFNETSKPEVPANYLKPGVNETENVYNNNKWAGWDNFGEKQETKQKSGWTLSNWGVNALLNTATSVTQGLSTVLEAGLGAPDPETLARMEMESIKDNKDNNENRSQQRENSPSVKSEEPSSSSMKLFPDFGITNLVAGVTKNIVEHTKVHEIGSKVISGGLDTLESFGKKTMEVLQEGDPGLKKKRALLLGTNKPTLSHMLREAKERAEMENKKMEDKQMAKLCHFETLFDDFQGLVHLEALEMLSRQSELKLEQMKQSLSVNELEDMNDILDEVKELCVIDEDEFKTNYSGMVDFKISLTKATEPLQNEISVQKIIQIYEEFNMWLKSEKENVTSPVRLFEKAMSVLAELTAATVQQFHKGGELLSVKERRKTVEEADALLQMTGIVCCEIDHITEKFLKLYTSEVSDNDVGIEKKIKEESVNATLYIKDAFNLLIPVLQLGATT